jgi:hypothetical protein
MFPRGAWLSSFCGGGGKGWRYTLSMERTLNATRRRGARRIVAVALAVGLPFGFFAVDLFACGASAGGAGVSVCSVEDHREAKRPKFRLGASYSWTDTTLVFSGDSLPDKIDVDQQRHSAIALFEWRATPRWNFQLGAGSLLGGELSSAGNTDKMRPGFVGAIGASFVAVTPTRRRPFLLFDAHWSSVFSGTEAGGSYSAHDLRLGTALGYPVFKFLSPYVLARVFGGPAYFSMGGEAVQGTDKHHYQLGAGLSAAVERNFDLFIEGVPLGERGLTAGLGWAF